ncbi:MAG: hypothetical protein NC548_25745 [Lachnospiraceae bacterium]|nr:hypothetical protein [Lachnospiraceae bacterium]
MARRVAEYQIGFSADTTALERAVQQAMSSLSKLSANPSLQLSPALKEASNAAAELATHLNKAFNQETKKIDLIDFNNSLKRSNLSLEDYANSLASIGYEGKEAFYQVAQAIGQAELPLKRSHKLLDELWVTLKNTVRWQVTTNAVNAVTGSIETAYGYC